MKGSKYSRNRVGSNSALYTQTPRVGFRQPIEPQYAVPGTGVCDSRIAILECLAPAFAIHESQYWSARHRRLRFTPLPFFLLLVQHLSNLRNL
jgi:hypothetical protein